MQKYHNFWRSVNFADMLEICSILNFENIKDYQKIYAIIYGCPFIAESTNRKTDYPSIELLNFKKFMEIASKIFTKSRI